MEALAENDPASEDEVMLCIAITNDTPVSNANAPLSTQPGLTRNHALLIPASLSSSRTNPPSLTQMRPSLQAVLCARMLQLRTEELYEDPR